MAKKIPGVKTPSAVAAVYDRRSPDDASPRRSQTAATKPAKPSVLLDTRVVYCGDNLEPAGRMQKEECRMMKPAHSPILHSSFILLPFPTARVLKKTGSFYYHCDWHASHYVKVMLDQIFGENNFFANNYLPV
jgi:hypothetical protein